MELSAIVQTLGKTPAIAQWQVVETRSQRHERYLTFLAVESEREVAATRWSIWLALAPVAGKQGESSFTLAAGDATADLDFRLATALESAAAAQAPAWTLPAPGEPGVASPEGGTDLVDAVVVANPLAALDSLTATYAQAAGAAPWVRPSTLELFATVSTRRLVNHRGLDLTERRTRLYAEFVLLHKPADPAADEVEIYDRTEATTSADLRLGERVAAAAEEVRALPTASAIPTGTVAVTVSDSALAELVDWYADHADAALHARKVAALKREAPVVQRSGGAALDIAVDATVPSLAAYRFDDHGYAASRQELVRDGVLTGLHGAGRWMQVLGLPPRGSRGTTVVPAGATALAELLNGTVEVLRFSEFQPRHDTGAFSGEIRLAWWHRPNGQRVAVKGGSLSGVLSDAFANVEFSRELVTTGTYHGPKAARFVATLAG